MRRPFLLLATVILGVASIAVTAVSITLRQPPSIEAPVSANVATVLRYYDAVNQMIATGDPAALREVVHPELSDVDLRTSTTGGLDSIENYLAYLHAVLPDTRLKPGLVAVEGAEVITQVAIVAKPESLPLGFSLDRPTELWPSSEMFFVSNGQIIERKSQSEGLAAIRPLDIFPDSRDIVDGSTLEVTAHWFRSLTNRHFASSGAPVIITLVSGNLRFSLSRGATDSALVVGTSLDERSSTEGQVLPGQVRNLIQGEVLIVPPGAEYSLRNLWPEMAFVLSVSVPEPTANASEMATLNLFPNEGLYSRVLLNLPKQAFSSPAQLSFGNVSLVPGGRLAIDPETTLMVIWTVEGELATTSGRSGCVEAGFAGSPQAGDEEQLASLHLICPADTHDNVVLNTGAEPATAWVIAVTASQSTA